MGETDKNPARVFVCLRRDWRILPKGLRILKYHTNTTEDRKVTVLAPHIRLVPGGDGTYDIFVEYPRGSEELAAEFGEDPARPHSGKMWKQIRRYLKKVRVKSVKVFFSGVLVASVAVSSLAPALAASDRYSMGYLYSGTEQQQIEYVERTNHALDTVSPSYFNLQADGSLKLNYPSRYLIDTMHRKGIRVVPFLSNHWDRTAGIRALQDVQGLSTQLAGYVEEYDLDGINVDIENVTHEQRDAYTQLVRLLREKIPAHKEVSVAVAANPNGWQTGWHGSYDYAALAEVADHLFLMTYDEHYEGGEAGPVASIDFVERSIQYALRKADPEKIVVGLPFYGRVWSLDNGRIAGKGISIQTIQDILENCVSTVTYDQTAQSVKAEFTITKSSAKYTVGGDFVLQPGKYVVWYENDASYQAKLQLVQKYNLKGAGSWSLGQEDPSIWEHYDEWLNGKPSNPSVGDEVKLDTQMVYMIDGISLYDFLVKGNNDTDNITVTSSNGNVASVALHNPSDSRGAKYRVTAKGVGRSTITATYQGESASMEVVVYPKGGSITLDTVRYTMAPGGVYDIGVTVTDGKGNRLSGEAVRKMVEDGTLRVRDSRTGSIVSLRQLSNGNFRIIGKNPGTCYIVYEVVQNGQVVTHASVRVDVQAGASAGGIATRNTSWWADKSSLPQ